MSTPLVAVVAALAALGAAVVFVLVRKGRRLPGEHVFRASRLTRGNRLLPAQVVVTPESITLFHPQWIGRLEESIHIAHVASVKIDTDLLFSSVFIETTGGHNPIVCRGHTRGDAVRMKQAIERFQSAYYRTAR